MGAVWPVIFFVWFAWKQRCSKWELQSTGQLRQLPLQAGFWSWLWRHLMSFTFMYRIWKNRIVYTHYIILYHIISYYIISYYIILYNIILYYIFILYHILLYFIISYYIISYHIILYYIILYYIILYYIILYYIILYYILSYHIILYHIISYYIISYYIILYHIILSCHTLWQSHLSWFCKQGEDMQASCFEDVAGIEEGTLVHDHVSEFKYLGLILFLFRFVVNIKVLWFWFSPAHKNQSIWVLNASLCERCEKLNASFKPLFQSWCHMANIFGRRLCRWTLWLFALKTCLRLLGSLVNFWRSGDKDTHEMPWKDIWIHLNSFYGQREVSLSKSICNLFFWHRVLESIGA